LPEKAIEDFEKTAFTKIQTKVSISTLKGGRRYKKKAAIQLTNGLLLCYRRAKSDNC